MFSKLPYGKYHVEVKRDSGELLEEHTVRAWRRSHAAEKVAKNVRDLDNVTFGVKKLE